MVLLHQKSVECSETIQGTTLRLAFLIFKCVMFDMLQKFGMLIWKMISSSKHHEKKNFINNISYWLFLAIKMRKESFVTARNAEEQESGLCTAKVVILFIISVRGSKKASICVPELYRRNTTDRYRPLVAKVRLIDLEYWWESGS